MASMEAAPDRKDRTGAHRHHLVQSTRLQQTKARSSMLPRSRVKRVGSETQLASRSKSKSRRSLEYCRTTSTCWRQASSSLWQGTGSTAGRG